MFGNASTNANVKLDVSGQTFVADGGSLTLNGNGGSTFGNIALNTIGTIAFNHATGSGNEVTVSGAVTGGTNSVVKNGAGDVNFTHAGAFGAGTIQYTGAGKVTLSGLTGNTAAKIDFNNRDGQLVLGSNATGISGNITTGGSNKGQISTTSASDFTFGGTIGADGQALKSLTLAGNTTLNGESHIQILNASNKNLTFNANAKVTGGVSTGGDVTFGNNAGLAGGQLIVNGNGKLMVSGGGTSVFQTAAITSTKTEINNSVMDIQTVADTVELGALTLTGANATLTSTTGKAANVDSISSSSANAVINTKITVNGISNILSGKLTLSANDTNIYGTANLWGTTTLAFTHTGNATIGYLTGSLSSTLENGPGAISITGTQANVATMKFTDDGGTINLGNNVNDFTSNVNFNGKSGTLNIGTGVSTVAGNIVAGNSNKGTVTTAGNLTFSQTVGDSTFALNKVTLGGDAVFENALHTQTLEAAGKNQTFKGTTHVQNAWGANKLDLQGATILAGGDFVIDNEIVSTGTSAIASKVTAAGQLNVNSGTLTLSGNDSALNGEVSVASGANLVFGQSGAITVGGAGISSSGQIDIGAGTVNVIAGGVNVEGNIRFSADNGSLVLGNNVTAFGAGANGGTVDFNGKSATVNVGDLDAVNMAFSTTELNTGKIITASMGGTTNFQRDIGTSTNRLSEIVLGQDAVFSNALNVKTLSAVGKNITFSGDANITDAWSANTVTVVGNKRFEGGNATIAGDLTSLGINHFGNQIAVGGTTRVNSGTLNVENNNSVLGAVTLGNGAGTPAALIFRGASIGAVSGADGVLQFTNAAGTTTNVGGNIGVSGAALNRVTVGAGIVDFGANEIHATSLKFTDAGTANLSGVTNSVTQNIDFDGHSGNMIFGSGHALLSGDLGTATDKLNQINMEGSGVISGPVHARLLAMKGAAGLGDIIAQHDDFNSGVYFYGDHTLELTHATRIGGDIESAQAGIGKIIFGKGFGGVDGNITARIHALTLTRDADVTGNMRAATNTHIAGHKLIVGGDFEADANTTLHFNVDDATTHGKIEVGGAVTIHEDTSVKVTVTNGTALTNGQTITLIDGDGGTGVARLKTDKLETLNTTLLTFTQGNSTEDLEIVVQRQSPGNGGTGENNQNTGNALERAWLNTNDPDLKAFEARILSAKTTEELNALLESVAPDMSGGAVAATVAVSDQTSTIVNNRVSAVRSGENTGSGIATGNGWTDRHMWAQAFGAKADQGKRGGVAGYDTDTYGFVAGVDGDISDRSRLGVALSYANTDVKAQDVNRSSSDVDSYQISLYGDHDLGNDYFLNGQVAYIYSDVDTKRFDVGGVPGNNTSGSYHNNQYAVRAELGKAFDTGSNYRMTPSISANYNYVDVGSYSEKGAGGLGLRNVETDHLQILEFGAHLSAEATFHDQNGGAFTPALHAGYRYDVIGDRVATTASFAGGGAAFGVKGADPAQGTFNIGGGFSWDMPSGVNLSAQYDYQAKSDYDKHSGYVRGGYRF